MGQKDKKHEDITIRHYLPNDEPYVKVLFALGIMSNFNAGFLVICSNPLNIGIVLSLAAFVLWISSRILVALLVAVGMVGSMYYLMRTLFVKYITASIQDDLSNIQKVYKDSGGCFLVAIDDNTSEIVGTVGLEGKGNGVFELRRMSVHSDYRGLGIGRRLLARLDQECKRGKIVLSTSSFMYSAHALYQKCGFVLTKRGPLEKDGFLRHFSNLDLLDFEKVQK